MSPATGVYDDRYLYGPDRPAAPVMVTCGSPLAYEGEMTPVTGITDARTLTRCSSQRSRVSLDLMVCAARRSAGIG
jgi:hypothetical protein